MRERTVRVLVSIILCAPCDGVVWVKDDEVADICGLMNKTHVATIGYLEELGRWEDRREGSFLGDDVEDGGEITVWTLVVGRRGGEAGVFDFLDHVDYLLMLNL